MYLYFNLVVSIFSYFILLIHDMLEANIVLLTPLKLFDISS